MFEEHKTSNSYFVCIEPPHLTNKGWDIDLEISQEAESGKADCQKDKYIQFNYDKSQATNYGMCLSNQIRGLLLLKEKVNWKVYDHTMRHLINTTKK